MKPVRKTSHILSLIIALSLIMCNGSHVVLLLAQCHIYTSSPISPRLFLLVSSSSLSPVRSSCVLLSLHQLSVPSFLPNFFLSSLFFFINSLFNFLGLNHPNSILYFILLSFFVFYLLSLYSSIFSEVIIFFPVFLLTAHSIELAHHFLSVFFFHSILLRVHVSFSHLSFYSFSLSLLS